MEDQFKDLAYKQNVADLLQNIQLIEEETSKLRIIVYFV